LFFWLQATAEGPTLPDMLEISRRFYGFYFLLEARSSTERKDNKEGDRVKVTEEINNFQRKQRKTSTSG
jgi:hypothetical protein